MRCWQNADGCKARDEGRSPDYDAEEGPRSVAPAKLCSEAGQRSPSRSHVPRLHAPVSTTQTPHFAATRREGCRDTVSEAWGAGAAA
ncbi:MAG TPA: hypothetical protein VHE58_10805 [Burkholderiales bacterium]|nr:hypothetical protein [Burkholderiales bacterium]